MLKMKTIMDGYDAGYADAERAILNKLDAMIANAEILLKINDSLEQAQVHFALLDVRKKLFGKYSHEE